MKTVEYLVIKNGEYDCFKLETCSIDQVSKTLERLGFSVITARIIN